MRLGRSIIPCLTETVIAITSAAATSNSHRAGSLRLSATKSACVLRPQNYQRQVIVVGLGKPHSLLAPGQMCDIEESLAQLPRRKNCRTRPRVCCLLRFGVELFLWSEPTASLLSLVFTVFQNVIQFGD